MKTLVKITSTLFITLLITLKSFIKGNLFFTDYHFYTLWDINKNAPKFNYMDSVQEIGFIPDQNRFYYYPYKIKNSKELWSKVYMDKANRLIIDSIELVITSLRVLNSML